MKVLQCDESGIQFKAKPAARQMKAYTNAITEGLNLLNKELGIIIHNSSVPSAPKLNVGIGSLLSQNAEANFIPFLRTQGFSKIQQDPDNIRATFCPSPYSPIATTKNIFMIPLERLASEEYNYLINPNQIVLSKDSDRVDYDFVQRNYDSTLRAAYDNFVERNSNYFWGYPANRENKDKDMALAQEFVKYKATNYNELEPAAIYEILSKKNNNEDWRTWNEVERNLYDSPKNASYIEAFRSKNESDIEFYIFKQWLAEREISKANSRNAASGMGILGDSPVALTPVEEWLNKDLFLEGMALGCPPDGYAPDGQRWDFSVIKPETLFNPDGSLGRGGELLKSRYEKMFKASPGGARIDHIIGLIDPWVYSKNQPKMTPENSGRLYSSPGHPILGKYAKNSVEEYAAILERIVIPAAQKYGLGKDDIICEDLGTVTQPVREVIKRLGLSGIAVTEFDYRGRDVSPDKVIMLGSHDNSSFVEYTDNLFSPNEEQHRINKTYKLAQDTAVPNQDIGEYHHRLMHDKLEFMRAAFAELFTSPARRIQFFFTDLFGIGKTYNKPGTTEGCWTLRLPANFEKLYYENVKKGIAVNLPEVIATAIRQREDISQSHKSLLDRLDEFAAILRR